MKLIARILLILAAALVVVGITFELGQTSYAQNLFPSRGRPQMAVQTSGGTTTDASSTTERAAPARGGESRGASLFGIVEVVKDLVIIAVITGAVSFAKRLLPKRQPKAKVNRPNAPPALPSSM